jgi:UrcA family protein
MICCAHRIAVSAAVLVTGANLASAEVIVRGNLPSGAELRTEDVAIGDLNLITESGQATLMGRLRVAVRDVCQGPLADLRNRQETVRYDSCHSAAMEDATSKAQVAIASAHQRNATVAAVIRVQAPSD